MAASVSVIKIKTADEEKIRQNVALMSGSHVLVGFPQGDPKAQRDEGGMSNAALAALHNSGSPSQGIPPRPFMDGAFESNSNRDTLRKLARGLVFRCVRGRLEPAKALGVIGIAAEGMVKDSIRDGDWIENAASTIARKESSRPLIDTEQMLNAVTHKVVSR